MKRFSALLMPVVAAALAGFSSQLVLAADGPMSEQAQVERLKKLDKDGDHMLSRDEVKNAPRLTERFDEIDANKDGKLNEQELRAFFTNRHPGKPEGKGPGLQAFFKKLDANNDGSVTRDELQNNPTILKNFDRIDTNKDSKISFEEAEAARDAIKKMQQQQQGK